MHKTKPNSSLEAITNAASCRNYFSLVFIIIKFFYLDNQLMQTISQTQNRAAKDKRTSAVDIQSLWSPLTQLGDQLSLALVLN